MRGPHRAIAPPDQHLVPEGGRHDPPPIQGRRAPRDGDLERGGEGAQKRGVVSPHDPVWQVSPSGSPAAPRNTCTPSVTVTAPLPSASPGARVVRVCYEICRDIAGSRPGRRTSGERGDRAESGDERRTHFRRPAILGPRRSRNPDDRFFQGLSAPLSVVPEPGIAEAARRDGLLRRSVSRHR